MYKYLFILVIALGFFTLLTPVSVVHANDQDVITGVLCDGNGEVDLGGCGDSNDGGWGDLAQRIVNSLSILIGAASVLSVIIGGLRYVLSGGDAQATQGARNQILYSLVGLAIAFLGYSIANFVIGRFT